MADDNLPPVEVYNDRDWMEEEKAAGSARFLEDLEREEKKKEKKKKGREVITHYKGQLASELEAVIDILTDDKARESVSLSSRLYQNQDILMQITGKPGEMTSREVPSSQVPVILDRFIRFETPGIEEKPPKTVDPTDRLIRAVETVPRGTFPWLEMISDIPLLDEYGNLLPGGYHEEYGVYIDLKKETEPLPEEITLEMAQDAARDLLDPFQGFPFVDEESKSATLALLLNIIFQYFPVYQLPLFPVTAPNPATGKSLLVDGLTFLGLGKKAPTTTPSWQEEENRKQIIAFALDETRVIVYDNITTKWGGGVIAQACTSGEIKGRELGKARNVSMKFKAVIIGTGNNIQYNKMEIQRRTVPILLNAQMEHPEERTNFKIPRLMEYLKTHRREKIRSALILMAGYLRECRPPKGRHFASFEEWTYFFRDPLIWIGMADPVRKPGSVMTEDDQANLEVLETFRLCYGKNPYKSSILLKNANDAVKMALLSIVPARSWEAMTAQKLGRALGALQDRPMGGLVLRGIPWQKQKIWVVEEHKEVSI